MKRDLVDIVAAAVCGFNVEIDMDNRMNANISEPCHEQCEYCRLMAAHICKQIEEGHNDK